jgi:glycosyltransferase involved in cell wall biosynthesis
VTRRVLLLSPFQGLDPPGGDTVYTQELLAHPPADVEYETYPDALRAGRLVELGRRNDYMTASGFDRFRALARIARERGINTFRKLGLFFREPFRYFALQPGAYDLVHCHVFSAAFQPLDAPLVMSNAATIEDLYRARGWSPVHVGVASRADAALARRLRVQHTSHGMTGAAAVVCFTSTLARELARRGSVRPDRIHVAPCFVQTGPRMAASHQPRRIGFIARAFDVKGGPTVLRAFDLARRERRELELIVIGCPPPATRAELRSRGITWLPDVPRRELLEVHMPKFDVFAYPTEFDGLPLTVLEVMARGIPIATSDYRAMPEVVGHGEAGSVTPQRDAEALAQAFLRLLEPANNAEARRRAAAWFDMNYSPDVAVPRLGLAYDAAIRIHGGRPSS